jgi:hypothetical protein
VKTSLCSGEPVIDRARSQANNVFLMSLNRLLRAAPLSSLRSLLIGGLLAAQCWAAETGKLNEHLEALRPYLGRTWRGEMKNSTPEKPVVDVARWERALNGQAIRVLHSINAGEYGGESLIFWSEEKKSLAYHYFTTGGFQTEGVATLEGGKLVSIEKVKGSKTGITEVKAIHELRPDGSMVSSAQYFKEGQWVPGHAATYREDPKAEVVFR